MYYFLFLKPLKHILINQIDKANQAEHVLKDYQSKIKNFKWKGAISRWNRGT